MEISRPGTAWWVPTLEDSKGQNNDDKDVRVVGWLHSFVGEDDGERVLD